MKKELLEGIISKILGKGASTAGKAAEGELSAAERVWRAGERRAAGQDIRTGKPIPGASAPQTPPTPTSTPKGNMFDKMGYGTRQSPVKPVGPLTAAGGAAAYGAATLLKNDPIDPLPADDKWGRNGITVIGKAPEGKDTVSTGVTKSWNVDPNKTEDENLKPPANAQSTTQPSESEPIQPKRVKTMTIKPTEPIQEDDQRDRNSSWVRTPNSLMFNPERVGPDIPSTSTFTVRPPNTATTTTFTPPASRSRSVAPQQPPQPNSETDVSRAQQPPQTAKPAPAAKPAAKPAPAPKAEEPPPPPKSREMYQKASDMESRGENSTGAYWAAVAQHEKEQGRTAPNDFSDSAVGKFFSGLTGGKKKVDEATKYLSMNPSSTNMFAEAKKLIGNQKKLDKNHNGHLDSQDFKMLRGEKMDEDIAQFQVLKPGDRVIPGDNATMIISPDGSKRTEYHKDSPGMFYPSDPSLMKGGQWTVPGAIKEAKKADKDYDGDGKIESPKDEVWGSRFKAAKKAGKMQEAAEPALKKSTTTDPDFAAPSANPDAPESPIKYVPPSSNTAPSNPPLPPKRPAGLKETYLDMLKRK